MKNMISNILAFLWFFGVVLWMLLLLFMGILGVFLIDIVSMLVSGFSSLTAGFVFLFLSGLVFGMTGLVPAFRRCYYKLPWLYPLSVILTMHMVILSIAETILAKGFEAVSTPRHIMTIIIMIVQIVVCRLIMCIYLKKKPLIVHKYDRVE